MVHISPLFHILASSTFYLYFTINWNDGWRVHNNVELDILTAIVFSPEEFCHQ